MIDGWAKKFKGSRSLGGAWIYTHPDVDRAVVSNNNGVRFNGMSYPTVKDAIAAAETTAEDRKEEGGS
jgi:hypothetical protein